MAHLKSVCETPALRDTYKEVLPQVVAYGTGLMQNADLYALAKDLRGSTHLTEAQSNALDHYLLNSRLLGAELPAREKRKYKKLTEHLATLCNRFSENLLDATMAWSYRLAEKDAPAGIPEAMLRQFRDNARRQNKTGYVINLEEPCYRSCIQMAESGTLRQKIYRAFVTRASELGEHPKKYNNTRILSDILLCRLQKANLLGFKRPAEMLMATNMMRDPAVIINFINDLADRALPKAREEARVLAEFARGRGCPKLQPWDTAFYAEKLRNEQFSINTEELRAYFPLPKVLGGMFALTKQLFDVRFTEEKNFETWHPAVRLFAMWRGREKLGYLYCDLYARPHKRSGAWMNENRSRRRLTDGRIQLPVAYLVCNFRSPAGASAGDSLLEHGEVLTLFHELGHCLHHLLTRVECRAVSGIEGVPHDMVELPSQLMENWCWNESFIKTISAHHKSQSSLPASKFKRAGRFPQFSKRSCLDASVGVCTF